MLKLLLIFIVPIFIFWCVICSFMCLYDLTGKRVYAVIGMLPLSGAILLYNLYLYIRDRDDIDWEFDDEYDDEHDGE